MIQVIENPSVQRYNAVLETTDGNFQQTCEHAEARKRYSPRVGVLRLLALHDTQPAGILQGMYTRKHGFGSRMLIGAVTGGVPILPPTQQARRRIVHALLTAMTIHAKARRLIEGVIYWPNSWGMFDLLHDLGYEYVRTIFGVNVDLTRTSNEIWTSFSSTKRKNIRKAMRYPLSIERGEDQSDVHEFHQLLAAAGSRKGFTPFPLRELLAIWSIFPKDHVHLFFVTLQSRRVAGVFVVQHTKSIFAIAAGSLRDAWFCRPNDFLHWKVIEWARHQGCVRYNLGALDYPIPNPATDGLWRWKRGFRPFLEKFHNFRATYTPGVKYIASLLQHLPLHHR
jgi:hypothetical protein